MVSGVPAHVDGRMLGISREAGGNVINPDRMWHYVEGLRNWDPIWPGHGIRILPGPSSLWLDATGSRLPAPLYPGFDTLATLRHLRGTGHDYSWFVLTQKIIEKEFALSGSEQNPDVTEKDLKVMLRSRLAKGAPAPVERFKEHGVELIGISVDSKATLRSFADANGYEFPLLADFWPHGGVAQEYGVFNAKAGFALRGTFLVDTTGTVRFAEVNGPGEPRNQDAWRKALAAI